MLGALWWVSKSCEDDEAILTFMFVWVGTTTDLEHDEEERLDRDIIVT